MAIRTTSEAVEGIIETEVTISLTPFIEVASLLVDKVCAPLYDEVDDAAQLEMIERWLSAHFYAIRDPRRTQEVAGSVSEQFTSRVDLGLDLTWYGQQAKLIDTKGGLKVLDEAKAGALGIFWMGKDRRQELR